MNNETTNSILSEIRIVLIFILGAVSVIAGMLLGGLQ
jgi:hypothetical protein